MDSLFKWNADIKNVEHKLPATELYETILTNLKKDNFWKYTSIT